MTLAASIPIIVLLVALAAALCTLGVAFALWVAGAFR